MPDYQTLYLKLFRASEQAISTLIAAQREREELYLRQEEPKLTVLSALPDNEKSVKNYFSRFF